MKKELSGNMGVWIVFLVLIAGGGTAGVMKWKGSKQKRKSAQDPDEEYANANVGLEVLFETGLDRYLIL